MSECTTGNNTPIQVKQISNAVYDEITNRANSTPSMEWTISPRLSILTSLEGTPINRANLNISTLGEINLRYSTENYTLNKVFIHKPLGFLPQKLAAGVQMEVSLLLKTTAAVPKYIQWIFPVVQGSTNENIALQSWLYSKKEKTVDSFEDLFPSQFQYIQWKYCKAFPLQGRSQVSTVTICYCTTKLVLDFTKTNIDTNLLEDIKSSEYKSSTRRTELYEWDSIVGTEETSANNFSMYSIISNSKRARESRKSVRQARCFNIQNFNEDGTVNVDTTGNPVDSKLLKNSDAELRDRAQESLGGIKEERSFMNTVIFWITISILIIFVLAIAISILLYVWRSSTSGVKGVVEASAGPGATIAATTASAAVAKSASIWSRVSDGVKTLFTKHSSPAQAAAVFVPNPLYKQQVISGITPTEPLTVLESEIGRAGTGRAGTVALPP